MFFNRRERAQQKPASQQQMLGGGPQRAKHPKLYVGAPIDIAREDGNHIFSGRLVHFNVNMMQMERLPGELTLPVLEEGAHIRMRGYADDMVPFEMTGAAQKSTRMHLVISELDMATDDMQRTAHRQAINLPAEIYALEGRNKDTPQECVLVDISINGARIVSKHIYTMDQQIRLRVELYEKAGRMSFVSQVVRTRDLPDGAHEYGLLFEQLTHEKMRYLKEDIQEVQDRAKRQAKK